jgi:hypothetical protein
MLLILNPSGPSSIKRTLLPSASTVDKSYLAVHQEATHDGKLIDRCARDQKPDGNRDAKHKIYTGSDRQDDVKSYVMCSVNLY